MSLSRNQDSERAIAAFFTSIRKKGIRLWSENGRLHYRAPKGTITQDEIETLGSHRDIIVELLETYTENALDFGAGAGAEATSQLNRVPLTRAQLAHWHFYQLRDRPAIRQIASATRLQGPLSVSALRQSLDEIVRRHDALRTRILVCDETLLQEVSQLPRCEMRLCDLSSLPPADRDNEIGRLIDDLILEPVDLAQGLLLGVQLVRIDDNEHVLMVAMEHIISDGFSLHILHRELFEAYAQATRGQVFSLPAIPVQFPDYAIWQNITEKRRTATKRIQNRKDRLERCARLRFPEDVDPDIGKTLGWDIAALHIPLDMKAQLQSWSRTRKTTLAMTLFTVYVGLVMRWCSSHEGIFQYTYDGRTSTNVQNTIGLFATILNLHIVLLREDNFLDLLNRIVEAYCDAHEHGDLFDIIEDFARTALTRNTTFNWLPYRAPETAAATSFRNSDNAITCTPLSFNHPMARNLHVDGEPFMILVDAEDGIAGQVWYPRTRFSAISMNIFARNFLGFTTALLRVPQAALKDHPLIR